MPAALGGEAAGWPLGVPFEARLTLDPARNPALAEWHLARFLARREGRAVGRVVAAMPRSGTEVAHFGFLALTRDPAVLGALLGAAGAWLGARGARRLRGPLSFSINHEVGALVEGGAEPMPRMPRNPPWLPAMLDDSGLSREKDVLACTLTVAQERHRVRFGRLLARWEGREGLAVRPLRLSRLAAEVDLLRDLYDDAWADNWGAWPVGEAEAGVMRRLLAPLLLSGGVWFALWRGEAVGVCALIPNTEPALAARSWPRLGLALLGRAPSARLPLLGVRRAWRGTAVSAMATGALLSAAIGHAERRGWARVEVSWILEDNARMLAAMARLPAPITGRWRLWGGALPLAG